MKRDVGREIGIEALDRCAYAVLAMTDGEGKPYCIPVQVVRLGEDLYFHSGLAGEKVDCLRARPEVCLTAVGSQQVFQDIYETAFTSAVVRGTVSEVTDGEEMRQALRAICRRYAPDCPGRVEEVIRDNLAHARVWKVRMSTVSGRRKDCGRA